MSKPKVKVTKAYHFEYKGYEVVVKLVRNEFWKWYVDAKDSFGFGTNARTATQAIKEAVRMCDGKANKRG